MRCWGVDSSAYAESTSAYPLQVALEHADMHQRRIRRVWPQVLGAEGDVVGRLVHCFDAVRMRIGKGIDRRFADDDTGLAPDVPRHAHMPGEEVILDPHPIARLEALAPRQVRSPRSARFGEGK